MVAPRFPNPIDAARASLARQVRSVFNDPRGPERPVVPSDEALFGRDSVIRRVHSDVVAMMVGGISALLLQMLHPAALQGVLDHSDFRKDMLGRLRRTARFIAVTTYGPRDDALAAIAAVNAIHARVQGTLPDGRSYSATDPRVLAWVHVAEATSFLKAYRRFADPDLSDAAQDRYFEEFAQVAERLGADPVPRSRTEAAELMESMRSDLRGGAAPREIAMLLLKGEPGRRPPVMQRTMAAAAVDHLPDFGRRLLALPHSTMAFPAVAATQIMGEAVRWAFAPAR